MIGEIIGRGAVADVHAYGDQALKLYHAGRPKTDPFIEAAILGLAEVHGLPAPRVYEAGSYDRRWGLVMDRVAGETLGQRCRADPADVPAGLDEMVRLQLMLHGIAETRLRPLRARLVGNIGRTSLLDDGQKSRLLERLAALPDGDRLCHGDFHPFNLIGAPGQTMIIDWLDTTTGAPAADACRSYLLLKHGAPEIAGPYLDRYVAQSGFPVADILAWLPVIAGARLAEGIANEEGRLLGLATDV